MWTWIKNVRVEAYFWEYTYLVNILPLPSVIPWCCSICSALPWRVKWNGHCCASDKGFSIDSYNLWSNNVLLDWVISSPVREVVPVPCEITQWLAGPKDNSFLAECNKSSQADGSPQYVQVYTPAGEVVLNVGSCKCTAWDSYEQF